MECGALAPLSPRDFSSRRKAMDNRTLNDEPSTHVPPNPDLTSRSLREIGRRGTLVVLVKTVVQIRVRLRSQLAAVNPAVL